MTDAHQAGVVCRLRSQVRRHDYAGRAVVKFHNRRSFFQNTGRWHRVERTIDKRANRYIEHITDAEAGAVVRHVDERLREDHQRHGSARER